MKKIISISVILLLFGSLIYQNGCSVGMALSGKKSPDLGAIRIGSTRGEIEMHLGRPIKSIFLEGNKRVDTYEYEIGNEPSAGRAIGHGVMDIMTFGAWEIIGTPVEGIQGDKYEILITYDENDKVIEIKPGSVQKGF